MSTFVSPVITQKQVRTGMRICLHWLMSWCWSRMLKVFNDAFIRLQQAFAQNALFPFHVHIKWVQGITSQWPKHCAAFVSTSFCSSNNSSKLAARTSFWLATFMCVFLAAGVNNTRAKFYLFILFACHMCECMCACVCVWKLCSRFSLPCVTFSARQWMRSSRPIFMPRAAAIPLHPYIQLAPLQAAPLTSAHHTPLTGWLSGAVPFVCALHF